MPEDKKLTVSELSDKIKAKYPQYKDIDDNELVDKIVAKYPQYGEQLEVKKKVTLEQPSDTPLDGQPTQDGAQPSGEPLVSTSQALAEPTVQEGELDTLGSIVKHPEEEQSIAPIEEVPEGFQVGDIPVDEDPRLTEFKAKQEELRDITPEQAVANLKEAKEKIAQEDAWVTESIKQNNKILEELSVKREKLDSESTRSLIPDVLGTKPKTEEELQRIGDYQKIEATDKFVTEANNVLQNVKDGDMSFGDAFKEKPVIDIILGAITEMEEVGGVALIAAKVTDGKPISDEEKKILKGYQILQQAKGLAGDRGGVGYEAGGMTRDMIPFLVDIVATRGFGGAVKKGTEKLALKAVNKFIKLGADEAVNVAFKQGTKVVSNVSAKALQASVMSTTPQRAVQSMIGDIQTDDSGNMTVSEGKASGEAYFDAVVANTLELTAETMFSKLPSVAKMTGLSKAFNVSNMPLVKISQKAVAKLNNYSKKVGETLQFDGFAKENLEEAFVGIVSPFTTGEGSVQDYFTARNLTAVALTTALMQGSVTGVGLVSQAGKYTINEVDNTIEKKAYNNLDGQQRMAVDAAIRAETPEAQANQLLYIMEDNTLDNQEKAKVMNMVARHNERFGKTLSENDNAYFIGDKMFGNKTDFLTELQKQSGKSNTPVVGWTDESVAADANAVLQGTSTVDETGKVVTNQEVRDEKVAEEAQKEADDQAKAKVVAEKEAGKAKEVTKPVTKPTEKKVKPITKPVQATAPKKVVKKVSQKKDISATKAEPKKEAAKEIIKEAPKKVEPKAEKPIVQDMAATPDVSPLYEPSQHVINLRKKITSNKKEVKEEVDRVKKDVTEIDKLMNKYGDILSKEDVRKINALKKEAMAPRKTRMDTKHPNRTQEELINDTVGQIEVSIANAEQRRAENAKIISDLKSGNQDYINTLAGEVKKVTEMVNRFKDVLTDSDYKKVHTKLRNIFKDSSIKRMSKSELEELSQTYSDVMDIIEDAENKRFVEAAKTNIDNQIEKARKDKVEGKTLKAKKVTQEGKTYGQTVKKVINVATESEKEFKKRKAAINKEEKYKPLTKAQSKGMPDNQVRQTNRLRDKIRRFEIEKAKSDVIDEYNDKLDKITDVLTPLMNSDMPSVARKATIEFNAIEDMRQYPFATANTINDISNTIESVMEGSSEKFKEDAEQKAKENKAKRDAFRDAVKERYNPDKEVSETAARLNEEADVNKYVKAIKTINRQVNAGVIDPIYYTLNTVFSEMEKNTAARGTGFLYKHFFSGKNGYIARNSQRLSDKVELTKEIRAAEEKYLDIPQEGVARSKAIQKRNKVVDKKKTGVTVNGVPVAMSQTQASNIIAQWGMDNGKRSLENEGYTQATIDDIKKFAGKGSVDYINWTVDEFLPKMREKYTAQHKEVFGRDLANIKNYFPTTRLKDKIEGKDEGGVGFDTIDSYMSAVADNQKVKSDVETPIDDKASFDNILNNYIVNMETAFHYTGWVKDINMMLQDAATLSAMNKLNPGISKRLNSLATTVINSNLDAAELDLDAYSKITAKVAMLNILYGTYTAFKQILSAPAWIKYTDIQNPKNWTKDGSVKRGGNIVKGINIIANYKWAMENSPIFRERIESRNLGDVNFNILQKKKPGKTHSIPNIISRGGFYANALVDAITISTGGKLYYDQQYRKYVKGGMSKPDAHAQAVRDFEIAYNSTQQSADPGFTSQIQNKKGMARAIFTVYENAEFGYLRQARASLLDARDNYTRAFDKKYESELKKNKGDKDAAIKAARKEAVKTTWSKETAAAAKNYVIFAHVLPAVWQWGIQGMPVGGWDEEDKDKISQAALTGWMSYLYAFSKGYDALMYISSRASDVRSQDLLTASGLAGLGGDYLAEKVEDLMTAKNVDINKKPKGVKEEGIRAMSEYFAEVSKADASTQKTFEKYMFGAAIFMEVTAELGMKIPTETLEKMIDGVVGMIDEGTIPSKENIAKLLKAPNIVEDRAIEQNLKQNFTAARQMLDKGKDLTKEEFKERMAKKRGARGETIDLTDKKTGEKIIEILDAFYDNKDNEPVLDYISKYKNPFAPARQVPNRDKALFLEDMAIRYDVPFDKMVGDIIETGMMSDEFETVMSHYILNVNKYDLEEDYAKLVEDATEGSGSRRRSSRSGARRSRR